MFATISLVWGGGFFLMKLAGFAFGPMTVAAISTFGGSIFLWGSWSITRAKWTLRRKHLLPLAFISFFGYIFPFSAQPFLVNTIGHGFVGMMVSLVPVLTIVVSIPLLGVFPSRIQFWGVLVGMISISLMMFDGVLREAKPLYLVLAVLVPVCYSISNTLIQSSLRDLPPIIIAAMLMTISSIVLIPLSVTFEQIVVDDRFMTALVAVLLLSILSRGLAMFLFYKLIHLKGPLFAGLSTYVIPVEALLWSWFDQEMVTSIQITAIAIVLLMVGIVQRDIIRRSSIEQKKGGALPHPPSVDKASGKI